MLNSFSVKKIFVKPLTNNSSVHVEAIINHFVKRNIKVNVIDKSFRLLFLPFSSIIIVEAIKSIGIWAFLRPDLKILHLPRGGSSLKVGWRSLNRLNWKNKIRLNRRNAVCMRNQWQVDRFSWEENFNLNKYIICEEPLDEHLRQKRLLTDSIHISLSECWNGTQITEFLSSLRHNSQFKDKQFFISLHPLTNIDPKTMSKFDVTVTEFGELGLPEYFITDCVSLIYSAINLGLKIAIVNERQTYERRLLEDQNNLFDLNPTSWQLLTVGNRFTLLQSKLIHTTKFKTSSKLFLDAIEEFLNGSQPRFSRKHANK